MTALANKKTANHIILACFIIGSLPLPTQAKPTTTDATANLPAALVLALADTCLGGSERGDHRPCDKSACHAALTIKRKKAEKQRVAS